ncbi:MAG: hypothetical protein ABIT38_17640 [Gemmatimonadaceae bacterium]
MRHHEQSGAERALRVVPAVEPIGQRAMSLPTGPDQSEQPIDVSVLVTVSERPGSLLELYRDFREPLLAAGYRCEFIFLIHPRYRDLAVPLRSEVHPDASIETVIVGRDVGETTLLRMGLARSRGRVLLTLPAYRQVQPSGIAELIAQIDAGSDLAVGLRSPRQDPLINRFQGALFNRALRRMGGQQIHDLGCNARAIRRDVLAALPLYGDFARFLPVLAVHRGYRLVEIPLAQDVRDQSTRLYSPGIYLRRVIDVLGLFFLLRFTDKPLRFFGLVGSALAGAGGVILLDLLFTRLNQEGIGSRPLLLLGMMLVTLGVQAIALGLIGEIVVHLGSTGGGRRYRVRGTPAAPSA